MVFIERKSNAVRGNLEKSTKGVCVWSSNVIEKKIVFKKKCFEPCSAKYNAIDLTCLLYFGKAVTN